MSKKKQGKYKDWAAEEHFDKGRSMIYVEASEECPIFKDKAIEFQKFLQDHFPDRIFEIVINRDGKIPVKPRDGAFEIAFSQNARTSRHELWTGVEKGPPRRLKFPEDFDRFLPQVTKVLNKIYVDIKIVAEEAPKAPEENENPFEAEAT